MPVANCTVDLTSSPNITSCPAPVISTNVPVQACTVGLGLAPNYVNVTSCPAPIITESIPQASCAGIVGTAPNWVTTLCIPVPREKLVSTTTTTSTTSYLKDSSGGVGSTIGTPAVSVAPSADESACVITATADPLPSPNPVISLPTIVNPGGSVGSLADVAQYYYATDLRTATGDPKATNNVRVGATEGDVEGDQADWQHMTTFVVGLGVSGTLNYNKDYKKLATGDFADIRNPLVSKAWPLWPDTKKKALNNSVVVVDCGWDTNTFQFYDTSLGINSDQDPCYFDPRSIDDFWHTAVNGRGTYFSADSPKDVVGGIKKALKDIGAATAAGSAAGATTLTPVFGDNTIFVAGYKTSDWTGDVEAREIDLNTGEVKDLLWSAKLKLDTQTGNACDNRNIYLFKSGATNNLLPFTWETSTCDANKNPTGLLADQLTTTEKAIFGTTNTSKLSQYYEMTDGTLGTVDQQTPAKGKNLVNFLRGQRGMEGFEAGVTNKLYRNRPNVLGDIINSSPVYVKAPFASYQDSVTPDYFTFKSDNASRRPMVYVGANDGMLHAFYATNPNAGQEAWAVIPSPSLETLYQLADNNYSSSATHQYFVDGTPSIGDIYDGTNWKTILVGGLNLGGKAYYALDITDPSAPIGLWEFKSGATCYTGTPIATDCHLGYSFGAPLITKIDDGTTNGKWVVIVTSGYNNVSSPSAIAGDGQGYLYVLDATNGQILHKISTGEGSATNPSGLTHVTSFVDSAIQNNLALRVYGGDLLGNIWRFDINDKIAPTGREATLVGTTKDSSGVAQPITIKPRLAEINGKTMLFVGTGKLLGVSDLTNAQVQSVYGVIDPLEGSPVYSDLRASLAPLAMTQTGTPPNATRQVACTGDTNTCVPTNGWVLDLPDTGERVNVGMELSQGVLIFGSNVPGNDPCSFAGYSWLNYVDFKTGVNVGSSSSVATWHSDSLIVGLNTFVIKGVQKAIVTTSDTKKSTKDIPQGSSGSGAKRISWREIAK